MNKDNLKITRKLYKDKLKERDTLLRCSQTKSVQKYINIMGLEKPEIPSNEDIILQILRQNQEDNISMFNCTDGGIYIFTGTYAYYENYADEYSPHRYLINSDGKKRLEEAQKKELRDEMYKVWQKDFLWAISYFYNLQTDSFINQTDNYPMKDKLGNAIDEAHLKTSAFITFPSLKEKLNGLPSFCPFNPGEETGFSMKDLDILRAQFYIMLMNNNYNDVLEYYSDENNWQPIEENANKYLIQKNNRSNNFKC